MTRPTACRLLLFALLAVGTTSCSTQALVCNAAGPINRPSNRTLRRDMLALAMGDFCKEAASRAVVLRLVNEGPVIGRLFPRSCSQTTMDNGDIAVSLAGRGYAWPPTGARKLTFSASAGAIYNQDFRCAEGSVLYAYFPVRRLMASDVQTIVLDGAGFLSPFVEGFSRNLMAEKLGTGFTVVRQPNGTMEMTLGLLELGTLPYRPYRLAGASRRLLDSDRSALGSGQRDFIPFQLSKTSRVEVVARLEGAGGTAIQVVPRAVGDAALEAYIAHAAPAALAPSAIFNASLAHGVETRGSLVLPEGGYYLIIDNAVGAGYGANATVAYSIQAGDAS